MHLPQLEVYDTGKARGRSDKSIRVSCGHETRCGLKRGPTVTVKARRRSLFYPGGGEGRGAAGPGSEGGDREINLLRGFILYACKPHLSESGWDVSIKIPILLCARARALLCLLLYCAVVLLCCVL